MGGSYQPLGLGILPGLLAEHYQLVFDLQATLGVRLGRHAASQSVHAPVELVSSGLRRGTAHRRFWPCCGHDRAFQLEEDPAALLFPADSSGAGVNEVVLDEQLQHMGVERPGRQVTGGKADAGEVDLDAGPVAEGPRSESIRFGSRASSWMGCETAVAMLVHTSATEGLFSGSAW